MKQTELSQKLQNAGLDLPSSNGVAPTPKPSDKMQHIKGIGLRIKELSQEVTQLTAAGNLAGEELTAAKELKGLFEGAAKLMP